VILVANEGRHHVDERNAHVELAYLHYRLRESLLEIDENLIAEGLEEGDGGVEGVFVVQEIVQRVLLV
jgi:hypothetical protein